MASDLSHLNPNQREAVLTTKGPLLVLAGAGSGKTRVITHRVEHLLEQGVAPESIVAISFTNKAADEMRGRLSRMVGKKRSDALVLGTFHALGLRMMRERPQDFGLPKKFSIIDQGDAFGVVRSALEDAGLSKRSNESRYDAAAILQRISLWKNDFLDQEEAEHRARSSTASEYDEIAAQIYSEYDERLRSLAALDFDDLVCRVATGLEDNIDAHLYWTQRFRYVLVDEYQDANQAQFKMLVGLLCPEQNICVVGDDDQAIYGWRGAKVANILGFDMYFPNAKVVKLEENYRCLPPIVDCANAVIRNNTTRHDKQLIAQRVGGDKATVVSCSDDVQQDKWVGQRIRQMIKEDNVAPGDIAVLYRSSRLAKPIEAELESHGIAYQILGGQQFFDRKEIRDVAAYLKVLVAPRDDLAIRRALDVPSRGVGRKTLEKLQAFAEDRESYLLDAVLHSAEIEGISGRPAAALKNFSVQVHQARTALRKGESMTDVLRGWINEIGLRDNILKQTGSPKATATRWKNVEWLFSSMERFQKKHANKARIPWREFVVSLELPRESEDEESVEGVITLATMHSAKGMEWPKVFIIGCEEGIMPHKRVEAPRVSDAISGDIDEERRLFYVGITRARDQLFMTRAAMRNERGREVEIKPSRFLAEIPPDMVVQHDVNSDEKLSGDDFEAMADAFLSSLMKPEGEGSN